jgi:hypothetical protein
MVNFLGLERSIEDAILLIDYDGPDLEPPAVDVVIKLRFFRFAAALMPP